MWREKGLFQLTIYASSWSKVRTGTHGRNLEAETLAQTIEKFCLWASCSSLLCTHPRVHWPLHSNHQSRKCPDSTITSLPTFFFVHILSHYKKREMSIKYIVNVTILTLFSASASGFLHQLFTSLCLPPTSGGAIVTTSRRPRDSGSETRNPGAVGKALFPVWCVHPQAFLAPMVESEQHQLQCSLGLFFWERRRREWE